MHRFPLSLALVSLATFAGSCTGGRGANGNDCNVTQKDDSAVIECGNGDVTVTDGKIGPTGTNGADGENGLDGEDGANSLILMAVEPASANCALGGTRIDSGLDEDFDGLLATDEIDVTQYLCNGSAGNSGQTALVHTSEEPVGLHCVDGGIRIDTGLDDNGNAILDIAEIEQTQYLCKTLCTVVERKVQVPTVAHASLDYMNTVSFDDNVLRVENTSGSDVVSWIGFDLTSVPDNSVILGTKLYLRHNPAIDTNSTDNPSLQVMRGTLNRFTGTTLTATNQPKGETISAAVTTFAVDGWTEIPITMPTLALSTDRDDNYMTLGLDETTLNNGEHFVAFYGSADATTRPYVEFSLISCETSL